MTADIDRLLSDLYNRQPGAVEAFLSLAPAEIEAAVFMIAQRQEPTPAANRALAVDLWDHWLCNHLPNEGNPK